MSNQYTTEDDKVVCLPDGGTEADVPTVLASADQGIPLPIIKADVVHRMKEILNDIDAVALEEYSEAEKKLFERQRDAAMDYDENGDLMAGQGSKDLLDDLIVGAETRSDVATRVVAKAAGFTALGTWLIRMRRTHRPIVENAADEAAVEAAFQAFLTELRLGPTTSTANGQAPLSAYWLTLNITIQA